MYLPTAENNFLNDFIISLKKRRKALKHKNISIKCERLKESIDGSIFEKLEIDFEYSSVDQKVFLRILVWSDRMIWIDIRSWKKPHWQWSWTDEGRFIGNYSGKDFIIAVEKTLTEAASMCQQSTNRFLHIWKPMLGKRPKLR